MVDGDISIKNMIKERCMFIKKLIHSTKQSWLSKILGFNT